MLERHEWELLIKIREEEARIRKPEEDRLYWDYRAKFDDIFERKDDDNLKRKDVEKLKIESMCLHSMERPKEDQFYKEMFGSYDTNISSNCSIYNHARPLYGIQCENCDKPLRGPSSTYCFECGWKKKV